MSSPMPAPPDLAMSPADLRAALARLGWTQKRLAEECGKKLRAAQGWCAGTTPVPALVARLVRGELAKLSEAAGPAIA